MNYGRANDFFVNPQPAPAFLDFLLSSCSSNNQQEQEKIAANGVSRKSVPDNGRGMRMGTTDCKKVPEFLLVNIPQFVQNFKNPGQSDFGIIYQMPLTAHFSLVLILFRFLFLCHNDEEMNKSSLNGRVKPKWTSALLWGTITIIVWLVVAEESEQRRR